MTIIIGRILSSIMNKPVKFKTKPIAPSFNSMFSFFLYHLRITAICKYTKPNSIIICVDINKKPHKCGVKFLNKCLPSRECNDNHYNYE